METIDITPTWEEILPHWLMLYKSAILGQANEPLKIIDNFHAEMHRMAELADLYVASQKDK